MLLTIQKVASYLQKYQPVCRIFFNANLQSIRLFDSAIQYFNSTDLYIGKMSDLPSETKAQQVNFILLQDGPLPELFSNHLTNVILIEPKYSVAAIINDVQDFFSIRDYIAASVNSLLDTLSKGKSIQEILNVSYNILGNPIMVTDSAHHMIGHAGWDETLDEPSWQYYLKHSFISDEYALAINSDIEFRRKMSGARSNPVLVKYDILKHREIINRIDANDITLAYLSVLEAEKSFTELDFEIIPVICNIISIAMQRFQEQTSLANSEIESFIIDILKEKRDPGYIADRISHYKFSVEHDRSLICIDAGQVFDSKQKMVFVRSLMQNFFAGSTCVIYNNKVVALIELRDQNRQLFNKDTLQSFRQILKSYNLNAGVSRNFKSFADLKMNYRQAFQAIKIAVHLKKEGFVHFYEDYAIHHLVSILLENHDIKSICHPQLLEMIRHDRQKNSNYTVSLYSFIQNNGDIHETSQKMHVHYNTLKYRLQKLEETLGINFSNYDTLAKFKLSFLVLEIHHGIPFEEYIERVMTSEEISYID